jgi:xylulokinase
MKFLLGFDIGSSSVKATLLEIATGKTAASAFSPSSEMPMVLRNKILKCGGKN